VSRTLAAAAVAWARAVTEEWRQSVGPGPGIEWDLTRSRELAIADDAAARLRELAADLGGAP
jgi:hypothetical protein